MLKIIIDSYIPYIEGALEGLADVHYLPFAEIKPERLSDADALIVRTRTQCNAALLEGSRVKFIASATIGYDHIDADYCREKQISWTNAPGCNALSVAQYLASALSYLQEKKGLDLKTKSIGIVGVGAVGSKIADLATSFGMRVLLNDPPRARREGTKYFVDLETICREADIISFHTLLNRTGPDKTYHLADKAFFERLRQKPVIINAARGEIVSTDAILEALNAGKISEAILDCWENEAQVHPQLLERSLLATPHIAGYSADGKANAARQSIRALSRFFGLGIDDWETPQLPPPIESACKPRGSVTDFFLRTYDIEADSILLKSNPSGFEAQRSNYPFRREPKAYLPYMDADFAKSFIKTFPLFF